MISKIKNLLVNLLTLVAVAVGVALVAVGYSDHIPPIGVHPLVACAGMAMPAVLVLNVVMLLVMLSVRWRRAWIPLLAFAVAYMPIRTFIPLHLPVSEEPPRQDLLRLMTYNVCCYGGNYKYDDAVDTIARYVTRQDIDVLCIQEEHIQKKGDPVARWRELYPYNDTLRVSLNAKGHTNIIGVHSRLPIIKKERIEYESRSNGSVAYYLRYGSDTIIVINNHLEGTHITAEERNQYSDILHGKKKQQVKEELRTLIGKLAKNMAKRSEEAEAIHRYVEERKDRYPIIVCGDFNDTPISYTRHTIAKGLTDCFVEAGCGLGLSYNRKGFNFRIDHILCSAQLTPVACEVDAKMDASDHYPVICSIKMGNNP